MNLKELQSEPTCCQCGMEKSHWSAREGVKREGDVFCCDRCAEETGCKCEETLRKARPLGKPSSRRGLSGRPGRPAKASQESRDPVSV